MLSRKEVLNYSYQTALTALYLAIFLFLPSYLFKNIICTKTTVVTRDKAFYKSNFNIKTLVTGDSHNIKILKTNLDKGIFNFATGGENYMQTYYKLRKALKQKQIETIIIPLNLNSFARNKFSRKAHLYYWNNYIDYIELTKVNGNYLENFKDYLSGTFFPYVGKSDLILNYISGKKIDEEKMLKAAEKSNKNFSELSQQEQKTKAEKRVKELFPEGYYNQTLEIYLHKLIALCKSQNIEIVIVTLPTTNAFISAYQAKYDLGWFENKRNELKNQYPELKFIDLRATLSDQNFDDSDHLNLSGTVIADSYILGVKQ